MQFSQSVHIKMTNEEIGRLLNNAVPHMKGNSKHRDPTVDLRL